MKPKSIVMLFLVSFLVPLCFSVGAPAAERPAKSTIAVEYFSPQDPDIQDIRVTTVSLESERPVSNSITYRGSFGVLFTRGTLHRTDGAQEELKFEADALGLGIGSLLRWQPIALGKIVPFAEGGVGMFFTTDEFPPGGTVWNFNYRYGIGASLTIVQRLKVTGSYRHLHVSNRRGSPNPRNPTYDGDGFMFAFSW